MNTVLVAEKRAQANVITRREEVASTRSLLNTAKLMDENQTLYCLLKFAVQCGGAIALGKADFGDGSLATLGNFAEELGIAFQLRDDYLGIFGSVEKFGKPIVSIRITMTINTDSTKLIPKVPRESATLSGWLKTL